MDTAWGWAIEIWNRHFEPLHDLGLTLDRVDADSYWKIHERELRPHFPPEAFIDVAALRTPAAVAGQRRIEDTTAASALRDMCILRDGERVAGSFAGDARSPGTYRMWHTNIHPDYRRRGIYRNILRGVIGYTRELGFDTIVSEHAPGNNPVLIAKLGAGFRITGMDVQPMVGVSIHLTYFHNPDHLAAYEFRCGLATLTPRIARHGMGAMSRMVSQLADAATAPGGSTDPGA